MKTEWLQMTLYVCYCVAAVVGAVAVFGSVMRVSQASRAVRSSRVTRKPSGRTANQTARAIRASGAVIEYPREPSSAEESRRRDAETEFRSAVRQAALTAAVLGAVTVTIMLSVIR